MLDFFEHIWTQAQKGGLPKDIWEAWEEYMGKMLSETRLRHIWQTSGATTHQAFAALSISR